MNQDITLEKAIEILGITNLEDLKTEDLDKLCKKAQKRWHPDRVAYLNSEETIEKYKRNFQLIDKAKDCIKRYLEGEINQQNAYSQNYDASSQDESEDITRRNAPKMQNILRKVWETIKEQGYKRTHEKTMVYEGSTLKDALKSDIEDKIPEICVISFFSGIALIVISLFATFIVGGIIVSETVPQLKDFLSRSLEIMFAIIFYLHVFSCFVAVLPISRYWLHPFIYSFIYFFVNTSYNFFLICAPYIRLGSPLGIFITIISILTKIVTFIILRPIYFIIGESIGGYTVGKLYRKGIYYAGLADWYIEEILKADTSEMDSDTLNHLAHFFGEMKEIWENQGYEI